MPDWACQRTGDCCRVTETVQVSRSELAALRGARPDVEPLIVSQAGARVEIAAGPCPYLAADGGCSVYAVRPWRCRVWACFRRAGEGYAHDALERRLADSAGVRRVWRLMLTEAEPWGRQHGWVDESGDARA